MVGFLLFGSAVFPTQAAFTSLFVMGDSISATTNGLGGTFFYGQRRSNGRVWVEVLAQRQGLAFDTNNNNSYFGNTSSNLTATINNFTAPSGVNISNILFVIWVNNADLYYPAANSISGTDLSKWTNAMNLSLTNHFKAIANLYNKGARTLIMPNAVDLSSIPLFDASSNTNFIHQRCLDYNAAFTNILNRARTNSLYPGLTIYSPDFFSLLTNIIAHPANYSVTNALYGGISVDVMEDPVLSDKTTNGPGTNYIFWDSIDPTAKVHMWMANLVQQLISPARISQITTLNGSNRLYLANVPVGQNGLVLSCTNLMPGNWTTNALATGTNTFTGTNTTQTIYVPAPGPQWFYRLKWLYSWTWP